jgi:hypothetical protein
MLSNFEYKSKLDHATERQRQDEPRTAKKMGELRGHRRTVWLVLLAGREFYA